TDQLFIRYAGLNGQYWLNRKNYLERSGSKLSWNSWAAFFGLFWVFYKGMWIYGMVGLSALAGLYATHIDLELPLTALGLLLGCFGNWIYVEHVKRRIARMAEWIECVEGHDNEVDPAAAADPALLRTMLRSK